jgi:hypothetical protein
MISEAVCTALASMETLPVAEADDQISARPGRHYRQYADPTADITEAQPFLRTGLISLPPATALIKTCSSDLIFKNLA